MGQSDTFDELAFERDVRAEKLLDGLERVSAEINELHDLTDGAPDLAEALDIINSSLCQIDSAVTAAERVVVKELG